MNQGNGSEIRLDDAYLDILLLSRQGYCCSQIMVKLVLRAMGIENPDLVRSMASLCFGIGYSWGTCGVLTGALCGLSLRLGDGELPDPALAAHAKTLMEWFSSRAERCYGGTRCEDILTASPGKQACADLMAATLEQVLLLDQDREHSGGCDGAP